MDNQQLKPSAATPLLGSVGGGARYGALDRNPKKSRLRDHPLDPSIPVKLHEKRVLTSMEALDLACIVFCPAGKCHGHHLATYEAAMTPLPEQDACEYNDLAGRNDAPFSSEPHRVTTQAVMQYGLNPDYEGDFVMRGALDPLFGHPEKGIYHKSVTPRLESGTKTAVEVKTAEPMLDPAVQQLIDGVVSATEKREQDPNNLLKVPVIRQRKRSRDTKRIASLVTQMMTPGSIAAVESAGERDTSQNVKTWVKEVTRGAAKVDSLHRVDITAKEGPRVEYLMDLSVASTRKAGPVHLRVGLSLLAKLCVYFAFRPRDSESYLNARAKASQYAKELEYSPELLLAVLHDTVAMAVANVGPEMQVREARDALGMERVLRWSDQARAGDVGRSERPVKHGGVLAITGLWVCGLVSALAALSVSSGGGVGGVVSWWSIAAAVGGPFAVAFGLPMLYGVNYFVTWYLGLGKRLTLHTKGK